MNFLGEFPKYVSVESVGVAAAVIGALCALLGLLYTRGNSKLAKDESKKRPSLDVGVFNDFIQSEFRLVLPLKSHNNIIVPLAINLRNEGKKSSKDTELLIHLNDSFYGRELPRELSNIASARGVKFASEEGGNESMTKCYFKVGAIPPDSEQVVETDLIINNTTVSNLPVEATTSDGVDVTVNVLLEFSIVFSIVLTYEDAEPVKKVINIGVREGKMDAIESFIASERQLKNKLKYSKERRTKSFAYVFFDQFQRVKGLKEGDDRIIYKAKNAP